MPEKEETSKCHFCGVETESEIPEGLFVCIECLFHSSAYEKYIKEKFPFMTTETITPEK